MHEIVVIAALPQSRREDYPVRGKCEAGVSAVLEYMITFIIAFVLFTVMLTMFNGMFINAPTESVCAVQFTDVGNDVAAKLLDTYLVAPEDGSIYTNFEMPGDVAGKGYNVKIEPVGTSDAEVEVYSGESGITRKITVNGIHSTISLTGSTTSSSDTHWVSYESA